MRFDGSRALSTVPTCFDDSDDLPELGKSQKRLKAAQYRLWASQSRGVLLIFQGLDASGKDGCIRQLVSAMHPTGARVKAFTVPTELEARHDFLWRAWAHMPAQGEVALFNRSYYEAVIIDQMLSDAATGAEQRLTAIRALEQHLIDSGTVVVKFWLHISREEQRRRLLRRLEDVRRQWKFDPSDIDGWQHRDRYLELVTQAMAATSSEASPWYVLPADDKGLCRRALCAHVADVLEHAAGDYPQLDAPLIERYRGILENGE
ncbi:polyphosphate kinase [Spongiibacter sp. KMU-166]|uniref:Polyphosphate kinase n=1 Tax=Spongiibacter thalassae TaxID=2721624 RepID=A0ABX1GIM6_9GAMM|nr:polyphosphate kinase [Spongiibacter thalassae]NKI18237.1 polyphosphate kinase [Spongiibacter thalassae]